MINQLDNRYFFPKVVQVVPSDDYKTYIYFNNGSVRMFDVKPLIKKGTVFEPLLDINIFKDKITVINDTIAWDLKGTRNESECIDLDPMVIFDYEEINDPLKE